MSLTGKKFEEPEVTCVFIMGLVIGAVFMWMFTSGYRQEAINHAKCTVTAEQRSGGE